MEGDALKLKIALWSKGINQTQLAKQTGINRSIISLAAVGRYNLDRLQKCKIAEALTAKVEELFK